jgi:hypothetical protein
LGVGDKGENVSASENRIVAVSLLTQQELDRYGSGLKKVFAINDGPCFEELLQLLDDADREGWRQDARLGALKRLRSK